MNMVRKILLLWVAYLALHFVALVFPHRPYEAPAAANAGLQFLLFLLFLEMARTDAKAFRPVLINLAILFGFSLLQYLSIFVGGALLPHEQYASVYYHEYVNKFGHAAVLSMAIVYLLVDYTLREWKAIAKYALTLCLLATMLVPLYLPYFKDPLHLYRTEEYSSYLDLKNARDTLLKEKGVEPAQGDVIQKVLTSRFQGSEIMPGAGLQGEKERLSKLMGYFADNSALILFWKPLNLNGVYINTTLLSLIIVFYFFKFHRDKPYGAYFEKILFVLFLLSSLDVLHLWAYSRSTDSRVYYHIHQAGQYLTLLVLLSLVYVCSLRLRFVASVVGKFYEKQILLQPDTISRWRDEIDTLVLNSFLQKTPFIGRLGISETEEEGKKSVMEVRK
jgi:hypothetical protein